MRQAVLLPFCLKAEDIIKIGSSFPLKHAVSCVGITHIWAAQSGIVSGVGEGLFSPITSITSQEMAVMLANYTNLKGIEIPAYREMPSFRDYASIADCAYYAARALAQAGVINGSYDEFAPLRTASRAEVATMFKNYLRFVVEGN